MNIEYNFFSPLAILSQIRSKSVTKHHVQKHHENWKSFLRRAVFRASKFTIIIPHFHLCFCVLFLSFLSHQHCKQSNMSSLMSSRIRGVVGHFLRAPRVFANVPPTRGPQPLCSTSIIGTRRSNYECQPRTYRYFSSQANILEEEYDAAIDMNRDPLFVQVYPGSRVLEMALPYDAMKMKQIDAMIRSTQPLVMHEKDERKNQSVEGCNVLSPALVTSFQAQLEGLCTNASVRIMTAFPRSSLLIHPIDIIS